MAGSYDIRVTATYDLTIEAEDEDEAIELSNAGLTLDDLITETVVSRGDQAEAAGPDGLVIAEPSWFPAPDATPEEARRWLDEFSGWALSDEEDSDEDEEGYC